jgi:hypothetical protein
MIRIPKADYIKLKKQLKGSFFPLGMGVNYYATCKIW